MNNRILVTTTSSFENETIESYLDLVTTNVVAGTNIVSDFSAALSDIFGGRSSSYQKELKEMTDAAIANLKEQAAAMGGNAIVGLKMDFGDISGANKSMFMVSAVGTAVRLQR